jgi:hypothetical protein
MKKYRQTLREKKRNAQQRWGRSLWACGGVVPWEIMHEFMCEHQDDVLPITGSAHLVCSGIDLSNMPDLTAIIKNGVTTVKINDKWAETLRIGNSNGN